MPSGSQPRMRVAAIREHVGSLGSVLEYAEACLSLGHDLNAATPQIPEPDRLNGQADEWLELIDASVLEGRHRWAAEQVTACLPDLKATRQLYDAHPIVASLIEAVEHRDVTAYSESHQH